MSTRPVIFISAVSKELRSARGLAARLVHSLGYDPKDQDMARTEHGHLKDVLRRWIDQSEGVIQLVGKCYGAEPSAPDPEFGRLSYTQFEARYALSRGKPVWYFFVGDDYPADAHEDEPEALRALQSAYADRIRLEGDLRHRFTNDAELENAIHRIDDHLDELRRDWEQEQRRARRFRILASAALLILIGLGVTGLQLGWWVKQSTDAVKQDTEKTRELAVQTDQKVDVLHDDNAKLLEAVRLLPQTLRQQPPSAAPEDEATRIAHAYTVLETQLKIPPGILAKELPQFAQQLLQRADTSALDRANALFATQKFAEAEAEALKAKDQALAAAGQPVQDAIAALEIAGIAANGQTRRAQALEYFRAAAVLTNEIRDALEWARVQFWIAVLLDDEGKAHDAEPIYRRVVEVYQREKGEDHPDTLFCRMGLAGALLGQSKYAKAEAECRTLLPVMARVLGPEHPQTLSCRACLAATLPNQGRHADAEVEYRSLCPIMVSVLGANSTQTLSCRMGLATELLCQSKYADAEAECRTLLPVMAPVLGPEHPQTLSCRACLAAALPYQGKHADAEVEYRSLCPLMVSVLGANSTQTLSCRTGLANALQSQDKHAEAEQEYRAVLNVREILLGAEHPDVAMSCYNLALCLQAQQNMPEALTFMRRAEQVRTKVLGPDHQDTKDAKTWREGMEAALKAQP